MLFSTNGIANFKLDGWYNNKLGSSRIVPEYDPPWEEMAKEIKELVVKADITNYSIKPITPRFPDERGNKFNLTYEELFPYFKYKCDQSLSYPFRLGDGVFDLERQYASACYLYRLKTQYDSGEKVALLHAIEFSYNMDFNVPLWSHECLHEAIYKYVNADELISFDKILGINPQRSGRNSSIREQYLSAKSVESIVIWVVILSSYLKFEKETSIWLLSNFIDLNCDLKNSGYDILEEFNFIQNNIGEVFRKYKNNIKQTEIDNILREINDKYVCKSHFLFFGKPIGLLYFYIKSKPNVGTNLKKIKKIDKVIKSIIENEIEQNIFNSLGYNYHYDCEKTFDHIIKAIEYEVTDYYHKLFM